MNVGKAEVYQPLGGNEMPRFGGSVSMTHLPVLDTAKVLVTCFVGVPMDKGTSKH